MTDEHVAHPAESAGVRADAGPVHVVDAGRYRAVIRHGVPMIERADTAGAVLEIEDDSLRWCLYCREQAIGYFVSATRMTRVTGVLHGRDRSFYFTADQTFVVEHPRWHVRLRRWLACAQTPARKEGS